MGSESRSYIDSQSGSTVLLRLFLPSEILQSIGVVVARPPASVFRSTSAAGRTDHPPATVLRRSARCSSASEFLSDPKLPLEQSAVASQRAQATSENPEWRGAERCLESVLADEWFAVSLAGREGLTLLYPEQANETATFIIASKHASDLVRREVSLRAYISTAVTAFSAIKYTAVMVDRAVST